MDPAVHPKALVMALAMASSIIDFTTESTTGSTLRKPAPLGRATDVFAMIAPVVVAHMVAAFVVVFE